MFPSFTLPARTRRRKPTRRRVFLESLEDRLNPAPPLTQTITGITFDEDQANQSSFQYHIPPDPYGAAGPSHVVSIVNTSINIHRISDGTRQLNQSLKTFFAAQTPINDLFDPKVVYDQFADRFVVVALERNLGAPTSSRIMMAVSDDSDPNGTWRTFSINSKINIGGVDSWADYPGIAVDEEAVYVTNNMFSFGGPFTGARLWIMPKGVSGGWYSGGTATFTVHDPYASAGFAMTSMPAHIYGTAPSGATGTFLVGYGGLSNGTEEFIQVVRVDNPLTAPTFNYQQVNVGNIDNTSVAQFPGAPQAGGAMALEAGDRRVYNAVWRNNRLYFATSILPSSGTDAGQITAHWFNFNTTNPTVTLVDQGNVGAEDLATGTFTYYPNVAVDAQGNMAIGFAASAPTLFPGAYYTGRVAGAPAGTVQSTGTLQAGLASYVRTFGSGRNRWGDYSGMTIDPTGQNFWVFNEYAMAQGTPISGENGRWATRWGKFTLTNTAPRVTTPISDVTVNEDAADTDINLNPHFEDDEDADAALVYSVAGNNNTGLVTASIQAGGIVRLDYVANASGTALITIRATDTGGMFVEDQFQVTVNAVNDAPVLDNAGNMVLTAILEDATGNTGTLVSGIIASAGGDRITDVDAGAQEGLAIIAADTTGGTWEYSTNNGTNWNALGAVSGTNARLLAADVNTRIRLVPALDFNGIVGTALTFRAWDRTTGANGDLADPNPNGGTTAYSTATETAAITVTAVNDVPSFTKGSNQTVNEDPGAQTVPDWATNISKGPANESGQTVTFLVTNDNNALFSVQPAVTPAGILTYTPAANANGVTTVTVRIQDDGGTANGGKDTSDPQTFTITVNAVNDAPVLDNSGDMVLTAILEDATGNAGTLVSDVIASAGGDKITDPDAGAQEGLAVTAANSANGSWEYSTNNGTNWNALGAVSGTNARLLAADANTRVRFVPAADFFGTIGTGLTFRAWDRTTGANGDLADPNPNGGTTAYSTATETAAITVTPVNDVPSFTKGGDQTVNEDPGPQTVPDWATNISKGPANESGQTVNFLVTTNNDALFSALPAVAANGTLTFTPAANANGVATVTVRIRDDGGVANGGKDTSDPQTFNITVNSGNDAPVLDNTGTMTLAPVLEDPSSNPGTLISGVIASAGGDRITDPDAGALEGIAVIAAESANGTWEYTIDGGANWAALGAVSGTNARLLAADVGTRIRFVPAANFNGTAAITFRAWDRTSGANGGLADPSTNGGSTAFSTATETADQVVVPVNDAPSFTKGANQTVNEDADGQSVANWATNIVKGPANEDGQTVVFEVFTNNDALFSQGPVIGKTGTLSYTPAANAFGVATVTVRILDNGGTANGGVDASPFQTFTITVNPVNDAPSFTKGANQTVLEDAGPQTFSEWATALSKGPANESGQALTFEVTGNTNAALFSAGPAVSPTGTLTFTPAANANGTADITVRLKDNGGTDNGGVDTSATQTFTITVNAVNDAPSFTKGANQTVLEDAGAQSVAGWATNIAKGPADENGQTLKFLVMTSNDALFATLPAIDPANGNLTFTPAANANGSATVTVQLQDNGGVANGGADTSAGQTFTIAVTPVNDAPSFTKGANQTVLEDSGPRSVADWATALSKGPADESGQTLTFEITDNSAPGLFSAGPAVSPTGTLTFTPAANANGTAAITVRIKDDGGVANGGVDTSATQTFAITITSVNDAPSFTKGANQTVLEDASAQSIAGWATNILKGPADEGSQVLTFLVSSDNPALFSAGPAVAANGTLTYTPAANAFGVATVTVRLQDDGGTANGGIDTSPAQTFTITVNPVNDAPSFTKGADQTVLEDAGPRIVADWATGLSAGPANESGQTLSFEVTANSNAALFSAGPAVSPTGDLSFTPAANANGTATITLRIKDNGGTADGGVDTSATQTFTITVNAVNDAPSFTKGADQTVNEDAGAQSVTNWATNLSKGPADENGQVLTFEVVANSNAALFSAGPTVAANGTLTYTPAANANGSATIQVRLKDDGGVANGGVDTSATQTFTITVNSVNDAPSFTKGANQTVLEDAGAQTVSEWATNLSKGPADESGQTLTFEVTGNTNPSLFAAAPAVSPAGTLTYTPAANANGTATITLRLKDNGGVANGGADTSGEQSFTVNVTAVNDAPSFTKGANQTALEDAGAQSVVDWATALSKGPADENSQVLTFLVTTDNPSLFSAGPAVSNTGTLTYTPAANANGVATVTVRLQDDGGTTNGGMDTSPAQTFTITLTPVNDVPSFTKGADQTALEDGGPQTVADWATALSAGPANESGQTLTFEVTANSNPGLFAAGPAVSSSGALSYTPAANANGSATITLRVKDSGGTANGGVDTSATQTFTITLTPVNDAPSFTKGADQTPLEDAGAQTVTGWATNLSKGPADENGQALTFLVTTNNDGLFSALPAISNTGTLTYTTAANAVGTATVTVRLQDDGGTANGGINTSPAQTFTITVTPVNDAPSFTKGADQTALEDAGARTVPNWVAAMSPGPADEAGQTLTFEVTDNSNPSLFSTAPAVAANGTLTYAPAANANGSATITLRVKDNGGVANGGVDTSGTQTFVITVTPVNDAPSFTKGADQTALEDAGAQSVPNWATDLSKGPADENGQALTFLVTTNNDALFATAPAVSSTGTLTYTPAANVNGTATVTVRVRDDGGTANGGIDTSPAQTFTITVTPVNDAPSFTKGGNQTSLEDAGPQTVADWATALSKGPADESGQTLTFEVTDNSNPALFSAGPAVSSSGALSYTPAANAVGTATITLRVRDNGGTANGGVDVSGTQTFTITVNGVNDAPSFTKGANQTALEDAGAQSVTGWATAISKGPADENTQALTFLVSADNPALFSAGPAVAANGTLTYTPAANANGTATVTVRLQDDGGTANGGQDTSAAQTFTITLTAVNDVPTFTKGADQTALEDAGARTVPNWVAAMSPGPADESGQTLTFEVTDNSNPSLFSTAPAVAANGTLTYTPAANANGSATITLRVKDNGGVANGGVDTSATQTFTITVNPVNDAPSFTKGANQTALEDGGLQTAAGWATAISKGPANESGQTLTFELSTNNDALFATLPAIDPATGNLTYTPAANANGSATVTVRLRDNGGTADGGIDTSATQTFTIAVTAVNDAPSFTKGANQTALEDAGPQVVADWATALLKGPADEGGQTLTFEVTGNTNAALFAAGPAVSPAGALSYTPAANANGTATITLRVKDSGGTADGGVDTSATQTFTITIDPVNDAPSFTKGGNQTALEDAGLQTVPGWATSIARGPADESAQSVTFLVTNDSNALFAVQPAVSPTGTLTYTPAANANGIATVAVRLQDDGGTANGGINTSPLQTFTITLTPVNDAPSFTKGANQTALEDAGPQTVADWATALSKGPADESGQTLTFEVTGNTNPSLFSVAPAVTSSGALSYTPAANANGTATITLLVRDNGGVANGGVDTSATQSFTITVTPVNDAPSFTKGANQTALEDAGPQIVPDWATSILKGPADEAGQGVTFLVTTSNDALFAVLPAVGPTGTLTYTPAANANGSATVTVRVQDTGGTANGGIDTSAAQTFTIGVTPVNDAPSFTKGANQTALEEAGTQSIPGWATNLSSGPADEAGQAITFEVSTDNNALFAVLPAVSGVGTLTYTPAANAFGSATVTLRARDSGGTANGGVDLSPAQTFTITIDPVNDAPSFTKGANPTVLEDAGPQSIPGWATGLSAGPNEAGQALAFQVVSNSNPALFAAGPAVSPTGELTYTPAANAFGSATVQVRLTDDGGTANGGIDASAVQTFTVNLTPVNDAPSFTKGANQTADEDAGPQTVPEWATGLTPGPANEAGQTFTFEVVSVSDPTLFAVQPAVSPAGTLTYTPAANAHGTATIEVRVRDSGGTADGGVDTSPTLSFTINLTPVNDDPMAADDTATVGTDASVSIDVLANDTDVDDDPLSVLSFTQPAGGTVVRDGDTLRYTPNVGTLGLDTFTYTVADGQGGFDTATVRVNVADTAAPVVREVRLYYSANRYELLTDRVPVLAWSQIKKIALVFSQPVNVDQTDLTLTGQTATYAFGGFTYNATTRTATWTLAAALPIDRFTMRLDGTSATGVRGTFNGLLLGADVLRQFAVLPGDLDGNGIVTALEADTVKRNIGKRYPSPANADINGDGTVTNADYLIVKANIGRRI